MIEKEITTKEQQKYVLNLIKVRALIFTARGTSSKTNRDRGQHYAVARELDDLSTTFKAFFNIINKKGK